MFIIFTFDDIFLKKKRPNKCKTLCRCIKNLTFHCLTENVNIIQPNRLVLTITMLFSATVVNQLLVKMYSFVNILVLFLIIHLLFSLNYFENQFNLINLELGLNNLTTHCLEPRNIKFILRPLK